MFNENENNFYNENNENSEGRQNNGFDSTPTDNTSANNTDKAIPLSGGKASDTKPETSKSSEDYFKNYFNSIGATPKQDTDANDTQNSVYFSANNTDSNSSSTENIGGSVYSNINTTDSSDSSDASKTTNPYTYSYSQSSSSTNYTVSPDSPKMPKLGSGNDKYITKKFAVTLVVICIVASFLFGIGGGIIGSGINKGSGSLNLKTSATQDANNESNIEYTGEAMSTADVAAFAADSVVEITTESVQRGSFMQQYVVTGAGSGVIVSDNGYLITNNHVIDGAKNINVRLRNGTSYTATLVGTDSDYDVALLKIEATGLKSVVIGSSSQLQVGQTAVAIGNPLGELGGTVTSGIISALDRKVTIDNKSMTVLQTDASINPGNSGGGLFNTKGEFIGLVVAKSSGSDVEGLGFAIPSDIVSPLLSDLKSHGYVTGKPQLGVSLLDVTSTSKAKQYGVSQLGVYIASVDEGSGAASAGLTVGDCITAVNDTVVSSSTEVQNAIKACKVGDTVTVTVLRNGKTLDIPVVLQEAKQTSSSSASSSASSKSSGSSGNGGGNSYYGYGDDFDDLFDFFGF